MTVLKRHYMVSKPHSTLPPFSLSQPKPKNTVRSVQRIANPAKKSASLGSPAISYLAKYDPFTV